uniref:Uncharacterized protein n=1 Tax=Haptolina ericina TaxID=156174 RepID=A0A7S3FHS0_9EUKA|mmetsp:Transcript_71909/g.159963  ORF Transcript_71909/g.159963 Transcript_71909/m.159963 type:complete len:773 (+) Transcript_71909:228-2546(+)
MWKRPSNASSISGVQLQHPLWSSAALCEALPNDSRHHQSWSRAEGATAYQHSNECLKCSLARCRSDVATTRCGQPLSAGALGDTALAARASITTITIPVGCSCSDYHRQPIPRPTTAPNRVRAKGLNRAQQLAEQVDMAPPDTVRTLAMELLAASGSYLVVPSPADRVDTELLGAAGAYLSESCGKTMRQGSAGAHAPKSLSANSLLPSTSVSPLLACSHVHTECKTEGGSEGGSKDADGGEDDESGIESDFVPGAAHVQVTAVPAGAGHTCVSMGVSEKDDVLCPASADSGSSCSASLLTVTLPVPATRDHSISSRSVSPENGARGHTVSSPVSPANGAKRHTVSPPASLANCMRGHTVSSPVPLARGTGSAEHCGRAWGCSTLLQTDGRAREHRAIRSFDAITHHRPSSQSPPPFRSFSRFAPSPVPSERTLANAYRRSVAPHTGMEATRARAIAPVHRSTKPKTSMARANGVGASGGAYSAADGLGMKRAVEVKATLARAAMARATGARAAGARAAEARASATREAEARAAEARAEAASAAEARAVSARAAAAKVAEARAALARAAEAKAAEAKASDARAKAVKVRRANSSYAQYSADEIPSSGGSDLELLNGASAPATPQHSPSTLRAPSDEAPWFATLLSPARKFAPHPFSGSGRRPSSGHVTKACAQQRPRSSPGDRHSFSERQGRAVVSSAVTAALTAGVENEEKNEIEEYLVVGTHWAETDGEAVCPDVSPVWYSPRCAMRIPLSSVSMVCVIEPTNVPHEHVS